MGRKCRSEDISRYEDWELSLDVLESSLDVPANRLSELIIVEGCEPCKALFAKDLWKYDTGGKDCNVGTALEDFSSTQRTVSTGDVVVFDDAAGNKLRTAPSTKLRDARIRR